MFRKKRRKQRRHQLQNLMALSPLRGEQRGGKSPTRNELALSSFRLLTQPRDYGNIRIVKRKERANSLRGSLAHSFGVKAVFHNRPLSINKVQNVLRSLDNPLDVERICKKRKERREVLFAKKLSGGSHKSPTYSVESLVRC